MEEKRKEIINIANFIQNNLEFQIRMAKKEDLENEEFIAKILAVEDEKERKRLERILEEAAYDRKCKGVVNDLMIKLSERKTNLDRYELDNIYKKLDLVLDTKGKPYGSLDNISRILEYEIEKEPELQNPEISQVFYNQMTERIEMLVGENELSRVIKDTDRDNIRAYIERNYEMLYTSREFPKALEKTLEKTKSIHPIKKLIEETEWDKTPRMKDFLHEFMKVEDTELNQAISYLIFAQGINRIYNPGCQAEYTIVLIGGQGQGKSRITKMLPLNIKFHTSLKTLEGSKSIENIVGKWIVELEEMMAIKRVKDNETLKSYLTTQYDNYRVPYKQFPIDLPRSCIFIGTTNNPNFLFDKTGARRFLSVTVNTEKADVDRLYDNEDEVYDYIKQCWAEALTYYNEGTLKTILPKELENQALENQESIQIEDERESLIELFLESAPDEICNIDIWICGLNQKRDEFINRRGASNELTSIMQNKFNKDWERVNNSKRLHPHKNKQKYWRRKETKGITREEWATALIRDMLDPNSC